MSLCLPQIRWKTFIKFSESWKSVLFFQGLTYGKAGGKIGELVVSEIQGRMDKILHTSYNILSMDIISSRQSTLLNMIFWIRQLTFFFWHTRLKLLLKKSLKLCSNSRVGNYNFGPQMIIQIMRWAASIVAKLSWIRGRYEFFLLFFGARAQQFEIRTRSILSHQNPNPLPKARSRTFLITFLNCFKIDFLI